MAETKTLRIGDKLVVLNGKDPLRFAWVDDPIKYLYQFDDYGNPLFTGEQLDGNN